MSARSTPGLLDGTYVHRFGDGRAKSAGGTKCNDVADIMHHRVLSGERKPRLTNASRLEDFTEFMETVECLLDCGEVVLVDRGATD